MTTSLDSTSAIEPPKEELTEIEKAFLDEVLDIEYPVQTPTPAVFDDYALHRLSDGDILDMSGSEPTVILPASVRTGGPQCPSCARRFPLKASICPNCGIDLKTGRPIATSFGGDLDTLYVQSESTIRWMSWILWLGLFPLASNGHDTRKPHLTKIIAVITIVASLWFWKYEWNNAPQMSWMKNHVLWIGSAEPKPEEISYFYTHTGYGDSAAYDAKYKDLEVTESRKPITAKRDIAPNSALRTKSPSANSNRAQLRLENDKLIVAAHKALPREQQYHGRYNSTQLMTHPFLNDEVFYLFGNLLFLLIIGTRLNVLVGNLCMLALYLLLAAASGLIFMACRHAASPHPYLGASGAIMGLCGMFLVLMPMSQVHLAIWWRKVLWGGFKLKLKWLPIRGYWIVFFYIVFDVVATIFIREDAVAFWTHIGGLLVGAIVGMSLLFARLVNCRGEDLFTGLLGMNAWSLIGKPNLTRKAPLEYGW